MKTKFTPIFYFPNGHFQTIISSMYRKKPNLQFFREILTTYDEGEIILDWHIPSNENIFDNSSPILVVLHGLNGSSEENYIQQFIKYAYQTR